jgi:hypothetical protein
MAPQRFISSKIIIIYIMSIILHHNNYRKFVHLTKFQEILSKIPENKTNDNKTINYVEILKIKN